MQGRPRRLVAIPVTENAYAARRPDEQETTRLPLLQLALAAIHAHVPEEGRHILVIASQVSRPTAAYLADALERGYIGDLVSSTVKIQHGLCMDLATHHGMSRWHDVFYCQDMDVELLSDGFVSGLEALLDSQNAHFYFDHLTPVMHYGEQVVPRRPMCCMFAGLCSARARYPVSLEHIQGEVHGRDPSPLRFHRMWSRCAAALRRSRSDWSPRSGKREFHTDTGYAFFQLAPAWRIRVRPLPDDLRSCYVHRFHLSPRYGLSDRAPDGRTIADHLDEVSDRLREVYGVEPARPAPGGRSGALR
jgi:hypothetical protein